MIDAERERGDGQVEAVKDLMRAHGESLRADADLLAELGLRLDVANIIDFGPVALSRVSAAHARESGERKRLEGQLAMENELVRRTGDIEAYFELAKEVAARG